MKLSCDVGRAHGSPARTLEEWDQAFERAYGERAGDTWRFVKDQVLFVASSHKSFSVEASDFLRTKDDRAFASYIADNFLSVIEAAGWPAMLTDEMSGAIHSAATRVWPSSLRADVREGRHEQGSTAAAARRASR